MSVSRIVLLALSWAALALVSLSLVERPSFLVQPGTACFVLFMPWLACVAAFGVERLVDALFDGLATRPEDLPAERRARSAAALRSLGGTSLSAGLIAFFASVIATLNAAAASGGQANPALLVGGLGAMMLAPLYGLALKMLLYDSLAAVLEREGGDLGQELERAGEVEG